MKKKLLFGILLVILIASASYLLRGPNISNYLKKLILPELAIATGYQFYADKIVVNVIPTAVEIKGIRVFNDNGTLLLQAERAKGYIALSPLLKKELQIERLAIRNVSGSFSRLDLQSLIDNIQKYLALPSSLPLKVTIKSIILEDTSLMLTDNLSSLRLNKLYSDIKLAQIITANVSSGSLSYIDIKGREFSSDIKTSLVLRGDELTVKSLHIMPFSSKLTFDASANIPDKSVTLTAYLELIVKTATDFFKLTTPKEGKISAQGGIKITNWAKSLSDITLDLKVKGDFYLQTLMQMLNVTETLTGLVSADGFIKGSLDSLVAGGKASIKKGNIFGVQIDTATCNVSYKDQRLSFTKGLARVYGGQAEVDVWITLPVVKEYFFKVIVKDAGSKGIFDLIGFDPLVTEGKISGEIMSEGSSFAPQGHFIYTSKPTGTDILKKIDYISGNFNMQGNVLRLDDLLIKTPLSQAKANGKVDLNSETLDFEASGSSKDLYELTAPYFTALKAWVSFDARIKGDFTDPLISLKLNAKQATLDLAQLDFPHLFDNKTLPIDTISAKLNYSKSALKDLTLTATALDSKLTILGDIQFFAPEHLLDISEPVYKLKATLQRQSIKDMLKLSHLPASIDAETVLNVMLDGKHESVKISFDARLKNLYYSSYLIAQTALLQGNYKNGIFTLRQVDLINDKGKLTASGTLSTDLDFDLTAEAKNIELLNILPKNNLKFLNRDYLSGTELTSFKAIAKGNPHSHDVALKASIKAKSIRHALNNASLEANIKDRYLSYKAQLLESKLTATGTCTLKDNYKWTLKTILNPARYDAFANLFLKEPPKDLLLNLSGNINASGDNSSTVATATIEKVYLSLYGNAFSNAHNITVNLKDKNLQIANAVLKNEASEFTISGDAELGHSVNFILEGNSSLAPLKAIFRQIETARGNGRFVLMVKGSWSAPELVGGMTVQNGMLAFEGVAQRLSDIHGYLYLYDNTVTFEHLDFRVAGGDVSVKGTGHLKGFAFERFSLEARLKNVTPHISRNFWIEGSGTLYCRGTPQKHTLFGDLDIKRAKYSENISWTDWLSKKRPHELTASDARLFANTELNINIKSQNIEIDNNLAKATLKADLIVRGTPLQPLLFGKVQSLQGSVYFRNNTFTIIKSTAHFANPTAIKPYFDISAETTISGYKIKLILDGTLEQFNMSLSSNPHLDEGDIFALLAVGQTSKTSKGIEGGIGASEAAAFLAGRVTDVLEDRFKTIIGIDRLQISPQVSKNTGAISPKMSLEKKLGDNLYVTYSTVFDVVDEHIWKVQYNLTDKLSLVGVRDEKGGIGADVKFRFEFK